MSFHSVSIRYSSRIRSELGQLVESTLWLYVVSGIG